MKRVALSMMFLAVASIAVAQNPKAVIKSLAKNDITKSTELFQKINDNTREKMPEMCYLAEAALLNMPQQSGQNKVHGYKLLAENIDKILSSEHAEKTFHNLDVTLSDVITNIENASCDYIISKDSESDYVEYIVLAKRANHSRLSELEQHLERCRYNIITKQATIERCNFFLSTYPESQYYESVATILMELRYNEAMASNTEGVVEKFIAYYPNHQNINKAANHLMELRYKRIFNGGGLDEMKWFVEQYPDHEKMAAIKQTMADIEYPTLEDSRAALEQFIAYYPTTTQVSEAQNRVDVFDILENGDFSKFVRYYVRSGYDANYYKLQCSVAHINGYVILSNNIDKLALIRFANREGKVGYCNLEGNIILEPQFDSSFDKYFYQESTNNLEECTTERGMAVVSLNGKQGIINTRGEYILEPKYKQVALWSDGIAAIKSIKYHTDDVWEWSEYTYALYDYNGSLKLDNQKIEHGSDVASYPNWDTSWFSCDAKFVDTSDVYIKTLYINGKIYGNVMGGFYHFNDNYKLFNCMGDDQTHIINKVGEVLALPIILQDTSCLFDNVIGTKVSSWKSTIINLDTRKILSFDEYKEIYVMSDDRILVKNNDSTYTFLDKALSPAISRRFNKAHSFCNGSAAVYNGNFWYLINTQGEQISANYEDLAPLVEYSGLYTVMNEDKYGIIDAFGNIVVELKYELPNNGWQLPIYLQSHNGGIVEWKDGKKTQLYNIE